MKLATRLYWFAVALPVAAIVSALLVGEVLVDALLLASVDHGLQAQAAVEAVSLFDEKEEPHLHRPEEPMLRALSRFAAARAILSPSGKVEVASLDPAPTDISFTGLPLDSGAVLQTRERADGPVREIFVQVKSPRGKPYVLWIGEPLENHRQVLSALRQRGLLVALAFAFLAGGIATWQSRRLSARILALAEHMRAVEKGRLDVPPLADAGKDEIAELRDRIAAATYELYRTRLAEERLVADAAHELRTPLAGMAATIDVTLRRERTNAELVDTLQLARREVDRLTELARELLDLHAARNEQGRAEHLDLSQLLGEVVQAHRSRAEARGLVLRVSAPKGASATLPRASARRLLENLLDNAIKFSPDNGHIDVEVEYQGPGSRVCFLDDGPGIPRAEADFVFEPFHRVDHGRPGFGLGLAMVRDIAQRSGGRAYVGVARGEGRSTICLELPAHGP